MTDWITGEKFIGIADMVYAPESTKGDCNPLTNTFCPCALKEINIVYTHTMYVNELFDKIRKLKSCKFIVITHNCDTNVNDASNLPDNVIRWFSQNVNIKHPRVESIPIGLENDKWFKGVRKKDKMLLMTGQPRKLKNWLYLNTNVATNPKERQPLYDLLEDQPWVTSERGINGQGFDKYLSSIYTHNFVVCPDGNGIDTHRLWETLYMGSIPIVKKSINTSFYCELPICFVDDWKQIDREFLVTCFQTMSKIKWNWQMLAFKYWENKIKGYVSN
jgi:hypothetical protein